MQTSNFKKLTFYLLDFALPAGVNTAWMWLSGVCGAVPVVQMHEIFRRRSRHTLSSSVVHNQEGWIQTSNMSASSMCVFLCTTLASSYSRMISRSSARVRCLGSFLWTWRNGSPPPASCSRILALPAGVSTFLIRERDTFFCGADARNHQTTFRSYIVT